MTMPITPQSIKDKEFQIKFRGYDTVEVKEYHELVADEYFELLEQMRQQVDELDILTEERNSLIAEKKALEEKLASEHGSSEAIQTEVAERDSIVKDLEQKVISLQDEISQLKENLHAKEEDSARSTDRIQELENLCQAEKERSTHLQNKINNLHEQNEQLRHEELDFKSTLIEAQRFTNDLKKKSEREAREIIENARKDAEQLRQETLAELARYPAEIEQLKEKKRKVRDNMEALLQQTLDNLDIFSDSPDQDDDEIDDDLFQKINLTPPSALFDEGSGNTLENGHIDLFSGANGENRNEERDNE